MNAATPRLIRRIRNAESHIGIRASLRTRGGRSWVGVDDATRVCALKIYRRHTQANAIFTFLFFIVLGHQGT
jgi:hypothetical protein